MEQRSPPNIPFSLDDDFLDLSINDSQSTAFNDLTLIGLVVSDKTINFKAVKAILLNVWDFGTKVQITYLDRNKFAVSFLTTVTKARVLEACPWAIKGHIVILLQQ